MVEPTLLAPMITPSIGPSACELTLPASAAVERFSAAGLAKASASKAAPVVVNATNVVLLMIGSASPRLQINLWWPLGYALRSAAATVRASHHDNHLGTPIGHGAGDVQ